MIKKNPAIEHIGRVQHNKYDEMQYLERHSKTVAWYCNGYNAAPISDYINNPVFQEFLLESDYFGTKSDEKIYIDLRCSCRYTGKIEKPSRNDSKLKVTIELRNPLAKK